MVHPNEDAFLSDDEEELCPLCVEEMDVYDKALRACPNCHFSMCTFCFNNICENPQLQSLCPGCRSPLELENATYGEISEEDLKRHQQKQARKNQSSKHSNKNDHREKNKEAEQQPKKHHLSGMRVIQKNLVYVIGLNPSIPTEELHHALRDEKFFGQYGKIQKIVINRRNNSHGNPGLGVYVTFARKDDAARCIQAVDGSMNDGKVLRAAYGTTKYCSAYLRGQNCPNPNCMFLHEPGEEADSYTRQDLSTIHAARQDKARRKEEEGEDNSALPATASWAHKPALKQQSQPQPPPPPPQQPQQQQQQTPPPQPTPTPPAPVYVPEPQQRRIDPTAQSMNNILLSLDSAPIDYKFASKLLSEEEMRDPRFIPPYFAFNPRTKKKQQTSSSSSPSPSPSPSQFQSPKKTATPPPGLFNNNNNNGNNNHSGSSQDRRVLLAQLMNGPRDDPEKTSDLTKESIGIDYLQDLVDNDDEKLLTPDKRGGNNDGESLLPPVQAPPGFTLPPHLSNDTTSVGPPPPGLVQPLSQHATPTPPIAPMASSIPEALAPGPIGHGSPAPEATASQPQVFKPTPDPVQAMEPSHTPVQPSPPATVTVDEIEKQMEVEKSRGQAVLGESPKMAARTQEQPQDSASKKKLSQRAKKAEKRREREEELLEKKDNNQQKASAAAATPEPTPAELAKMAPKRPVRLDAVSRSSTPVTRQSSATPEIAAQAPSSARASTSPSPEPKDKDKEAPQQPYQPQRADRVQAIDLHTGLPSVQTLTPSVDSREYVPQQDSGVRLTKRQQKKRDQAHLKEISEEARLEHVPVFAQSRRRRDDGTVAGGDENEDPNEPEEAAEEEDAEKTRTQKRREKDLKSEAPKPSSLAELRKAAGLAPQASFKVPDHKTENNNSASNNSSSSSSSNNNNTNTNTSGKQKKKKDKLAPVTLNRSTTQRNDNENVDKSSTVGTSTGAGTNGGAAKSMAKPAATVPAVTVGAEQPAAAAAGDLDVAKVPKLAQPKQKPAPAVEKKREPEPEPEPAPEPQVDVMGLFQQVMKDAGSDMSLFDPKVVTTGKFSAEDLKRAVDEWDDAVITCLQPGEVEFDVDYSDNYVVDSAPCTSSNQIARALLKRQRRRVANKQNDYATCVTATQKSLKL